MWNVMDSIYKQNFTENESYCTIEKYDKEERCRYESAGKRGII